MKRGRVLYILEVEKAPEDDMTGAEVTRQLCYSEGEAREREEEARNTAGVLDVTIYPLKVGRALKEAK